VDPERRFPTAAALGRAMEAVAVQAYDVTTSGDLAAFVQEIAAQSLLERRRLIEGALASPPATLTESPLLSAGLGPENRARAPTAISATGSGTSASRGGGSPLLSASVSCLSSHLAELRWSGPTARRRAASGSQTNADSAGWLRRSFLGGCALQRDAQHLFAPDDRQAHRLSDVARQDLVHPLAREPAHIDPFDQQDLIARHETAPSGCQILRYVAHHELAVRSLRQHRADRTALRCAGGEREEARERGQPASHER
jgi:hypothetical protein